jgi:hypothetical protein
MLPPSGNASAARACTPYQLPYGFGPHLLYVIRHVRLLAQFLNNPSPWMDAYASSVIRFMPVYTVQPASRSEHPREMRESVVCVHDQPALLSAAPFFPFYGHQLRLARASIHGQVMSRRLS